MATKRAEDLTTALKGYDHEAYVRAASLIAAERRIAGLAEHAQERAKAAEAAGRAVIEADSALVAATSALDEISVARQHLEEAARLQRQLERMEIAVGELQAEILEVDADRRTIERKMNAVESLGRLWRVQLISERRRLRRDAVGDHPERCGGLSSLIVHATRAASLYRRGGARPGLRHVLRD